MPVDSATLELFAAAMGGAATGGTAAYYAAREAINVALARHDERINALRKDVDSDHGKLEDISRELYKQGRA